MSATITAETFDSAKIAKCDRLPKGAPFHHKMFLLVDWHIAKTHKEAAALLKAYSCAKRSAPRQPPMTFAQASLPTTFD